jgi:hypothetical protein
MTTTITKTMTKMLFTLGMAATLAACGGQGSTATSARIGPNGGQVVAAGSALTIDIPAGALSKETEIHVREVEPRAGEVQAFEIEPAEIQLEHAVKVTVKVDDASGAGKHSLTETENEVEHAAENEVEDANEHTMEGEIHHFGHIGVKRADDAAQAEAKDAPPHA